MIAAARFPLRPRNQQMGEHFAAPTIRPLQAAISTRIEGLL
jgi:hypothetical protein